MTRARSNHLRPLALAAALALGACTHEPVFFSVGNAEMRAAVDAAEKTKVVGPRDIKLAERTFLTLAEGLVYIPAAEGVGLLRAMGERPAPEILGLVVTDAPEPLLVAVIYAKGRDARGVPEVEVVGWERAPELNPLRRR